MKKFMKAIACAVVLTMLLGIASAADATWPEEIGSSDAYGTFLDPATLVDDLSTIATVELTFTVGDASYGGCVNISAESNGWAWNPVTFSNEDCTDNGDGTVTLVINDVALDASDETAKIAAQDWWGGPFDIVGVVAKNADGEVIYSYPAEVVVEDLVIEADAGISHNASYVLSSSDVEETYNVATISLSPIYDGDASWNDWCVVYLKLTVNGEVSYVPVIGAQVGWDVTVDDNGTPDDPDDDIVIPNADCVVLPEDGIVTVTLGDGTDWTIEVIGLGWESAPDDPFINVDTVTLSYDASLVDIVTPPAEDPTDEPTDTPTETPTEAPTATPSDAEPSDQPQTGDNGVVLFAVVGMLAFAGVVATKKHNA